MIGLPYNWSGKLKEGLNLAGHITDIRMHKQQLASAVKYWVVAVGVSLLLTVLNVWQRFAAIIEQWALASVPKGATVNISVTPAAVSIQSIVYLAALIGIATTSRAVLSGRARVVKSVAWYVLRFVLLSMLIGIAWGLGSGLAVSAFFAAKHLGLSAGFVPAAGRALFVIFGFVAALFTLRLTVAFLSFGAAAFLQGKAIRESYNIGIALLHAHWPYLVGLLSYFWGTTLVLRHLVTPMVSHNIMLAIVVGAVGYLLWPLYWLLILEYYKGAARSGRTAPRARRSPRSTSSSPRGTGSMSTRRAPRKK